MSQVNSVQRSLIAAESLFDFSHFSLENKKRHDHWLTKTISSWSQSPNQCIVASFWCSKKIQKQRRHKNLNVRLLWRTPYAGISLFLFHKNLDVRLVWRTPYARISLFIFQKNLGVRLLWRTMQGFLVVMRESLFVNVCLYYQTEKRRMINVINKWL